MVARSEVSFDPVSHTSNQSPQPSSCTPDPVEGDCGSTSSLHPLSSSPESVAPKEVVDGALSGSSVNSDDARMHSGAKPLIPTASPSLYQGVGITRPVTRKQSIQGTAETGTFVEGIAVATDSGQSPFSLPASEGIPYSTSVFKPGEVIDEVAPPSPQTNAVKPEFGKATTRVHVKSSRKRVKKSGAPVLKDVSGTDSVSSLPASQDDSGIKGASMPFYGHLAELRKRILVVLAIFIPATFIAFSFAEQMSDFILSPATGLKFVYLSPPDLFMALVKLSIVAGIAFSSPVIIFEIWMFVQPALAKKERGAILLALLFSGIFFAAGAGFAFFVIVPISMKFFLSYSNSMVEPMISIKEYLGFISDLCIAFGVTFELPIASALLGALGVLKAEFFIRTRKIAVLGIFIVAAILTPPDIVSQVLLALPMLVLFELSVWILKIQDRRRSRRSLLSESAD